jgi:hypothetical protein
MRMEGKGEEAGGRCRRESARRKLATTRPPSLPPYLGEFVRVGGLEEFGRELHKPFGIHRHHVSHVFPGKEGREEGKEGGKERGRKGKREGRREGGMWVWRATDADTKTRGRMGRSVNGGKEKASTAYLVVITSS